MSAAAEAASASDVHSALSLRTFPDVPRGSANIGVRAPSKRYISGMPDRLASRITAATGSHPPQHGSWPMAETSNTFMPASAEAPSDKQRLFMRYFSGILIDLVVLNLFVEYSGKVFVDSFTTSALAAVVLQLLLKATIAVEHRVAMFFKARGGGGFNTFLRYFFAWVVLFGSKFVILEAIAQLFGDNVRFEGRFHGIITLIVVVVVMLLVEELVVRFYRKLK
jgi:hypothetical protein